MLGLISISSHVRSDPMQAGLVRLLYTALPRCLGDNGRRRRCLANGFAHRIRMGLDPGLADDCHGGNPAGAPCSLPSLRGRRSSLGCCREAMGMRLRAGSLPMAAVIAGISPRALMGTDAGGRLFCRAWIPISAGSVVLATCAGGCLLHPHTSYQVVGSLLLLYGYSHIAALATVPVPSRPAQSRSSRHS